MEELWSIVLLAFFFGTTFGMIHLIERVQWRAGDRK